MPRHLLVLTLLIGWSATGLSQAPAPGQLPPGSPAPRQPTAPQVPPRGVTPPRDAAAARKGTAVLKGQVIDARTGSPIRRARVSVMTPEMSTPAAQTDAEGRFEIRDLVAGKHTINVVKSGYLSVVASNGGKRPPPLEVSEGQTIEKIVIALSKGGVISGQVLDDFGDPVTGAAVRPLRYQFMNGQRQLGNVGTSGPYSFVTDDLGAFRLFGLEPGDYFISASPGRDGMPFGPSTPNAEGPAPTFYPGTANAGEARRVTVRAGRETSGIVFPMIVTRLSRVRGRALSASGEAFAGQINISLRDTMGGGTSSYGGGIKPDGSFEFNNLQPGTYVVTAQPTNSFGRQTEGGEFARAVITVNGEDINDLVLIGSQGGVARGRIVTDEGLPPPFVAKTFSLMAQTSDPRGDYNRAQSTVREDWSFELTGLFDRVHLRPASFTTAPGATGLWTVKAVLVDGQDVIDSGIDFQAGRTVEGIEIVYTRKVSRVTGQLQNARGDASDAWVVLFPSDESKWTPQSRYIRAARPNAEGKYSQGVVPFDDYLVVGVTDIENGQWMDPDFLRVVKPLATALSIAESEVKVLDVKLVDWRRSAP